ncbi:MAG: GNAT family N-acetyltransferase [Pseudomonadota bacterium]
MFIVERLQPQDLPAIVNLACEFKLESQTVSPLFDELNTDYKDILRNQLKQYLQEEKCAILIAKLAADNTIIGFIIGYIWEYLPIYEIRHMGYIPELFVKSNYRSQGVGCALLSHVEDWFRQQNIKYSRIETIHLYARNKSFYEKRGYNVFLLEMRKIL